MSSRCSICRHPLRASIDVSVLRDGTRVTAREFQVRGHLWTATNDTFRKLLRPMKLKWLDQETMEKTLYSRESTS
jgi:hypothetical protein